METLKERDWIISSPDEDCRQQGVTSVKHSIEMAEKYHVKTVVVHAGHVSMDMTHERKLRELYQAGLKESSEYQETKNLLQETRLKQIGPRWEAVIKSLKELMQYAAQYGVRLGLENRYHYFDIPTQDEMSELLALGDAEQLGFIYDVGHATVMERLGFFPSEPWLQRFGERIYGTHLHDVIGLSDHQAPGMGEVDFRKVARYLPKEAFRTVEVMSFNTPEQVKNGMNLLVESGCVTLV